jgi:hypothetical protein
VLGAAKFEAAFDAGKRLSRDAAVKSRLAHPRLRTLTIHRRFAQLLTGSIGKCRKFERSCPSPAGALDQSLWCGNSFARPWKDRILGFWMTPSRISIARRIVWSVSHAAGPSSTVPRYGSRAWLISQVAEFQR